MEKVKFWKNTSSEFDKITSKDANTIYYLTDTGKIYLGEKMYGGADMPFTIVSKDDKRFSSFDTLYLKGENVDKFKLSVDPGVYCLADDMDFAFSAFILLKDYFKFIYEGQSEDQMKEIVYTSTQCTLPKGSFIYITENMLEIYCTYTDVKTYCPGGGSSESFTHCKSYIIGTFPVVLDDNEHVCGLIEFDIIDLDMENGKLTYPFEYAMLNAEGFKEGDTLVVTNNSDDDSPNWSGPRFKLGSAGVQATQIADDNYTNYQTMDQWLALNNGMYLVNTDKLSINVAGKNKVYSASSAGFCALLGIEENYNKSLSIPKGNYISVYTTEAGGSFYYKYKMMVIYQLEANPDSESENRPSAGEAVVITLGAQPGNSPEGSSFTKDIKVYDFNESLMLLSVTNNYVNSIFTPLTSPNTIPKAGQLAQWEGDADFGFKLKGVDAPKSESPFTLITNENATNYNTLDKLCHLDDGLYLCEDTYKANQDYIVDITFKGMDVIKSVGAMYGGAESTPESTTVRCRNGCLISVSSITSIHKNIRITQSAEETDSNVDDELFGDIYISAKSDDGSTTENPIYGVTGDSVNYIRPFTFTSVLNTYYPAAVLNNAFGSESQKLNGKLAKWETSGQGIVLTGADIKESPIIEVNDSNWSNFNTLQKWFAAEPGVYYINCTPVKTTISGIERIESYKTISAGFHFSDYMGDQGNTVTVADGQIHLPYKGLVYVTSTDQSGGGWYRDLHVYFPQVSNVSGTGLSGKVTSYSLDFQYSLIHGPATVANVTAANVELTDLGSGALAIAYMSNMMTALNPIMGYFESLKSSDIGKLVKIASPSSSDYGNEYEFQAADITLIGNSTAITPAQVLAAVNEGKTTTITYTDDTHGTFKFTSFGVISATSGDAVSSSITYGTGADSLTLYTLIGDVTNGTWTLYSKSLTVTAQ